MRGKHRKRRNLWRRYWRSLTGGAYLQQAMIVAFCIMAVSAFGTATITPREMDFYTPGPQVNYQHERTVPPSFGELNSPCYIKWTNGC